MAREPETSNTLRLVALGSMIAAAAILAITALVLAQGSPRAGAIPLYPHATRLCGGHVTAAPGTGGSGPHIEWTAYASADAPDTVVAWYERQLGTGIRRREGRQDVWRVPPDRPTAILNVSAPAHAGPIAGCTERPAASARTVLVVSSMAGPHATPSDDRSRGRP